MDERLLPEDIRLTAIASDMIALGNLKGAEALTRRVLRIQPDNKWNYVNLSFLLREQFRIEEALVASKMAISLDNDLMQAHQNCGLLCMESGRYDEAIKHFEECNRITGGDHVTNWDQALCYLSAGNYKEGFKHFEYRKKLKVWRDPGLNSPAWTGKENLEGKKIVIYDISGFGDIIQYLRYINTIKKYKPKHIFVIVPPDLFGLVQESFEGDGVSVHCDKEDFNEDYYVSLESIPYFCELHDKPDGKAYLKFPEEDFPEKLSDKFNVAILYGGSAATTHDPQRSISTDYFTMLSEIPNVTLYSVQKSKKSVELYSTGANKVITDLEPKITSFYDIAKIYKQMDLVISVDSAPLHLAGALGVPTWGLLAKPSEYRWAANHLSGIGPFETCWYSSVTLYRQDTPREWESVFRKVVKALGEEVEKKGIKS